MHRSIWLLVAALTLLLVPLAARAADAANPASASAPVPDATPATPEPGDTSPSSSPSTDRDEGAINPQDVGGAQEREPQAAGDRDQSKSSKNEGISKGEQGGAEDKENGSPPK
jgi:hypothetical protein